MIHLLVIGNRNKNKSVLAMMSLCVYFVFVYCTKIQDIEGISLIDIHVRLKCMFTLALF